MSRRTPPDLEDPKVRAIIARFEREHGLDAYAAALDVWREASDRKGLPHPGDALFFIAEARGRRHSIAAIAQPGERVPCYWEAPGRPVPLLLVDPRLPLGESRAARDGALRRLGIRPAPPGRPSRVLEADAVLTVALTYLRTLRGDDYRALAFEYLADANGRDYASEAAVPEAAVQAVRDRVRAMRAFLTERKL